MDAFAVAVCKGLALSRLTFRDAMLVGGWFGGFQALMPSIGFFLGVAFERYIRTFDHWIAFVLLTGIGISMVRDAISEREVPAADRSLAPRVMLAMAIATSVDALAVGVTFAFLIEGVFSLLFAVMAIGIITFVLSAVGVAVGSAFGGRGRTGAAVLGGGILMLLGVKILLEHLGVFLM